MSDGSTLLLFAGAIGGWLRTGRARRRLATLSGGVYIGLGVAAEVSGTAHPQPSHR